MRIDIVTLFPEICRAPLSESILKRAQEKGIVALHIHNLRDWTTDKHHIVGDAPFGGGQGMVMKPKPIFAAVEELKTPKSKIILMSPAPYSTVPRRVTASALLSKSSNRWNAFLRTRWY